MLTAGEVQRDVATLASRHDRAGEHARTLVRWLAMQAQHAHTGVVIMQHPALRRLVDQMNQALQIPGVSNAWTMPIRNRIDMLTTGVRTPVGVKVFGSDI